MSFAHDGAPPAVAAARASLERRGAGVAAALVALAALLAYAPALSNGFVNWDDGLYVTANPATQRLSWSGARWAFTSAHAANWHPLTWLSHMIDGSLFGRNAAGHHATSAVLHAVNAALLLLVLHRMTSRLAPSVVVAALFALHPLNVESVAWISERKNLLSTLFLLLTLGAYARYVERPSRARYAAVTLFFALGLMSKPMLVTLPCVLLLLDLWPLGRWRGSRRARAVLVAEKAPLFALALASCAVTLTAQRAARPSFDAIPAVERVANAALAYAGYIARTLAPVRLSPFYAFPGPPESAPTSAPLAAAALAALVTISALVWRARAARPHLFTGWFWFAGTLVPVIGLVQVGEQSMADRYAYVPLIGLFIAAAWSIPPRLERSAIARIVALCVLVALGVATARQTRVWRDSESLWRRTLELNPRSRIAMTNLGVHLVDAGRAEEAVEILRRAIALDSTYFAARRSLAVALAATGRQDEAIREGEAAIALAPRDADARYNLANALADRGRLDEAIARYREAATLDTAFAIRYNLALALFRGGDAAAAAVAAREALRAAPADAAAHREMGLLLLASGRHREAIDALREGLRAAPDDPMIANALAWLLATAPDAALRDGALAVRLGERAVAATERREPNLLDTLGAAYAEAGRFDDAVRAADDAAALARAAGDVALAAEIDARRDAYARGRPHRLAP